MSFCCCFLEGIIFDNSYFLAIYFLPGFWRQKLEQYLINNLHKTIITIKLNIDKISDSFKNICRTEFRLTEV